MRAQTSLSARGRGLLIAAAGVSFQVVLGVAALCAFVGGGHGS